MKSLPKRPTIKEVAAHAGVSPATVSLVLNGKKAGLPEETCGRVRAAARALGYSPDFSARAMVTGKTQVVGVILPDISNAFFAEAVRHIQTELSAYGYGVMLCNGGERAENDLACLRLLAGRKVDCLIFTPSAEALSGDNAEKLREALSRAGVPCVFFDRYYEGAAPKAAADNVESGRRMAEYLLGCGHRKIGILTGPLSLNSSRGRLEGVKKAFEAHGLELSEKYVAEGRYDIEAGAEGAKRLFETDATAIFAFSDMQAYGVYRAAREAGLSIPRDISVAGFDDAVYSALLETPLTTMRQPVGELASAACRAALGLIRGESVPASFSLPAELIVRGSVGRIN